MIGIHTVTIMPTGILDYQRYAEKMTILHKLWNKMKNTND